MRNRFHRTLIGLLFMAISLVAADDPEAGFVPMFDGRTLKHWILVFQNGPGYLAKDGKIICPACPADCTLFTDKEYSNFVFRFEFRMEPRGDNGIAIRSAIEGDPAYKAMEIQILDNEHPFYADVKPAQHHGSIYDVFPARTGFLKKVGDVANNEWNEEEITANGRRISIRLNGTVILDADLDSVITEAVTGYVSDVKAKDFPNQDEKY